MSPMSISLPAVCGILILVVICRFHGADCQIPDGYYQSVGCFSNSFKNFLELSCTAGKVISVEWVVFGTRPSDGCPSDGSLTEKEAHCCVPKCGDCVVQNDRDSKNVFDCNNKSECSVWAKSSWVDGCQAKKVTNYMVVLYKCNNKNNDITNTSLSSIPTFNNIYCGDAGSGGGVTRPGGGSQIQTTPPTTPHISGPRHVVGCYSSFQLQRLHMECQPGEGIAIYDVFFGAKSNSSCPKDGFVINEEQSDCCVPECGDCVLSQSNEASYVYRECIGQRECSPWTQRINIPNCGLLDYTSYMVVYFECVHDANLGSALKKSTSFEAIFGCPLPPTTIPPTTIPPTTQPPTTTTSTTPSPTTKQLTTKPPSTTLPKTTTTSSAPTSTTRSTTLSTTTTTAPKPITPKRYADGTYVTVGCYSLFHKPKIEIHCESNTHILIHGVYFGTRDASYCPESGLIQKDQEECCEPKCTDCYTYGGHGDVVNLLRECTFQQNCSVWSQRSVMSNCGSKSFSAYMAVHYQCTSIGMEAAQTMGFGELFCPPGTYTTRPGIPPPTLSGGTRQTKPTTGNVQSKQPQTNRVSQVVPSRVTRPSGPSVKITKQSPGSGPQAYPDNGDTNGQGNQKVLIGGMVGGIASVIVLGVIFVLVIHWRRREKTVVKSRNSLDRLRKRKRNISKNNSQCTNSTNLNSVNGANLTMVNVISNSGRLPGKGDYNHLERWLGDLETTNDTFDLPRISEVSESDTDADVESRVRRITTFPQRHPDILQESDS